MALVVVVVVPTVADNDDDNDNDNIPTVADNDDDNDNDNISYAVAYIFTIFSYLLYLLVNFFLYGALAKKNFSL